MPGKMQRQRLAAYAVIIRDGRILLSRLAERLAATPLWTLPGGGVDFGENPRDGVVREVHEETGLSVTIGDHARVYSLHREGEWNGHHTDLHSVRLVFEGWVPVDAPEPRVVEKDGSTVDAAWHPVADVISGSVPVVSLVREALTDHEAATMQRLAAYAVVIRDGSILLTRISALGHHAGSWTLPGGGVDHGERPSHAVVREVEEECGLRVEVGDLLDVHDVHFTGTAPSGRTQDFHGVHLLFSATAPAGAEPSVVERDGTTDLAAWVPVADVEAGRVEVLDVVRHALATALASGA